MSVTQPYKKAKLFGFGENCVEALSHSVLVLKLINKAKLDQLANNLHKAAEACHSDGAVDVTVLVAYADLHTLCTNRFFTSILGLNKLNKAIVKLSYVFTDEHGRHHAVPHLDTPYLEKYFGSVAGVILPPVPIAGTHAERVVSILSELSRVPGDDHA
jgi:hypothetical protein